MKIDKEVNFSVDPRWTIFSNAGTIEEFSNTYLFKDVLSSSVDKDLLDYEIIIKKLLTYSYYEYEFMTVAVRYSFLLFELGLRKYFFKLTGGEFKGSLSQLIKKYEHSGFTTSENSSVLDLMRSMRNHFTHPTNYNVLPPSVLGVISMTITIINELELIYSCREAN